jgi:hypothetical protein
MFAIVVVCASLRIFGCETDVVAAEAAATVGATSQQVSADFYRGSELGAPETGNPERAIVD